MLFEIIIGNYLDDTNRSKFILSFAEFSKKDASNIIGIAEDFEYIISIKKPSILVNAWDEKEWDELTEIKSKIS